MSHTYSTCLFHVVFSTKGRRAYPIEKMRHAHRYLVGIAHTNGFDILLAGGTCDHVHLLLRLPTSIDVAKAVRLLKAGSSKWFNEEYRGSGFSWQAGYAVFTVSLSQAGAVRSDIASQEEHHRKRDFAAEFVSFLEKYGIEYDPRYVFG